MKNYHPFAVSYASIKSKLNIPLPRANLGHSITFCAPGVGSLTFVLAGWAKLNRKCKVSNDFFFLVPKSLTAIKTCLDVMEKFKAIS